MIDDIRALHVKHNILIRDRPVHLTREKLAERANFMMEELREFAESAGVLFMPDLYGTSFMVSSDPDQDLELQAEALVKLVYIALVTAVQMGLPWCELWDDVHSSKMQLPDGEPPRTAEILTAFGYVRTEWVGDDGRVVDAWCVS